jgi:hypothetical protein
MAKVYKAPISKISRQFGVNRYTRDMIRPRFAKLVKLSLAALAQSAERRSRKAKVMSSILMGGSIIPSFSVVKGKLD